MKLLYLLLPFIYSCKITNINYPSCRNCVHHIPSAFDYATNQGKCTKFGHKNRITNEIHYNYADICRKDQDACGREGKYFEEKNIVNSKTMEYKIIQYLPFLLPVLFLIILFTDAIEK